MITNDHFLRFVEQAHRVGRERLMLCSSGNLSWRIGDRAIISGTGSWLSNLTVDKVAVCKIEDGTPVDGTKPSMESGFHLGVLRNRKDVNVVLHFQSEYGTVIACMENKPTNFNITAEVTCCCGREIPVVPYFRPGSAELAKAVTDALVDHDSALMDKHGLVVCGKDFDDAFQKAVFFEMACRIMVQSNFNYQTLTDKEIEELEVYVLGKKNN